MNNFDFAGRHILQVGGTTMGTEVPFNSPTPSWVGFRPNLYIPMWVRFMDDIFLIWTHDQDALKTFENHLNDCVPSINFETDIIRGSAFP